MRARLAGMDGPFAYSIYLCSGVLTWGLFTETLNSLVNVFLTNANILKAAFRGSVYQSSSLLRRSLTSLIIFGLFVLFLIVTGNFPGMIFFEIIPVLIVQMLFTLGLGIILGVLNVFVRDVGQFVNILLQFGSGLRPLSTCPKRCRSGSLVCWRITRWRPLSVHVPERDALSPEP